MPRNATLPLPGTSADEPVPESLTLLVATIAAQDAEDDMTDASPSEPPNHPAPAFDLAAHRARRDEATRKDKSATSGKRKMPGWWKTAIAMAACVTLGVGLGARLPQGSAHMEQDGTLSATGTLATGLESHLASGDTRPETDGNFRIIASFQRKDARYCRVYDARATSGIACKDGGHWILERTMASPDRERGDYRQAGSSAGELMAAAQDMAEGTLLTPAQEQAARKAGWQSKL
ncbi:transcriptional regulator [Novosphingobium gossypii]|uniref:transcriptional regulator n=1 Tax=Novosphingobium gossypii TaxID=1604774 RepID=UPI003D1EA2A7